MLFRFAILTLLISLSIGANGQDLQPVDWHVSTQQTANDTYEVNIKAQIEPGWVIYSMRTPANGPIATSILFDKSEKDIFFNTAVSEDLEPTETYDELFGQSVIKFSNEASYTQIVTSDRKNATLTGSITYMTCNGKQCMPPKQVPFVTVLN